MIDNSGKVVPLNKRSGSSVDGANHSYVFARLPAPFLAMKDKGMQGLQSLLQALFDNIDDALFELADRAEHNAEQNMYFESMREVRIKRRGMELNFVRELDAAFKVLLSGEAAPPILAEPDEPVSIDSLSLVGDDEMEELVAVDSMVAKAECDFGLPLKQFTTRLDTLIDMQGVTRSNNPFGPAVICRSFITVCAELDMDIKAKLVLFKLFDRYVMQGLSKVYALCNQELVDGGILPKLGQRDGRISGQQAEAQILPTSDSPSVDIFSDLQNLLHKIPQGPVAGSVSSGLVAPGQAPQIPREGLMQLLQAVQQTLMPQMEQQRQAAWQGIVPEQLSVQQSLSSLLTAKMPTKPMSIGQVDDDAINLVAMLFQFVLDDRNLAAPMKALIARLQIPIIKVAMLDKTFFSKGGHPARKLLNEIAHASLGWTPTKNIDRDPLYNKVSSIVNRLLNDFDGDSHLFHEMLTDFIAFIEMDKRRSHLVEQRTVNAEDGKAKSEVARKAVQAALNDRVAGKSLPPVVITLLEDAWSNVLFLTYLKDGVGGKNWQAALQVVDDLLWSVEPVANSESRQRLMRMVPGLLKRLRVGLGKIGFNPFDMNQLFSDLETIHLTQLKALNTVQQDIPAPVAKPAQAQVIEKSLDQLLEERSGSDVSLEELDAQLDQQFAEFDALGDLVALSSEDETASTVTAENGDQLARQFVEQLHFSGTPAETDQGTGQKLQEGDPSLQRVDDLVMGHWIELHQEGGKKFRCRLAAIIRSTGKYIFVNRSGMKVAEYQRMSLALAIQQGTVSTLDDGLLFDRALESVIGNLRSVKSGTD